jgi:uncharacterized protein involved in tellurium resistance
MTKSPKLTTQEHEDMARAMEILSRITEEEHQFVKETLEKYFAKHQAANPYRIYASTNIQ